MPWTTSDDGTITCHHGTKIEPARGIFCATCETEPPEPPPNKELKWRKTAEKAAALGLPTGLEYEAWLVRLAKRAERYGKRAECSPNERAKFVDVAQKLIKNAAEMARERESWARIEEREELLRTLRGGRNGGH